MAKTSKAVENGSALTDPQRRDLTRLTDDLRRVVDEAVAVFQRSDLRRRYNGVSEDEYLDCLVIALEGAAAEAEDRLYDLEVIDREREEDVEASDRR